MDAKYAGALANPEKDLVPGSLATVGLCRLREEGPNAFTETGQESSTTGSAGRKPANSVGAGRWVAISHAAMEVQSRLLCGFFKAVYFWMLLNRPIEDLLRRPDSLDSSLL
jgi:hypothetical protein